MRPLLPWLPAAAWAAVLFYLSSLSTLPSPGVSHSDKAAHFAAYLVLGLLLAFAADRTARSLALAAALGLLYGASDEVHQLFVPGRSASLGDWMADAAGVCFALYLYARLRPRRSAGRDARRTEPTALRA